MTHIDNIIEGALSGRYDGAPKKYVHLYDDLMAAGVPYAYVAGFQSALYHGLLHQHAMKYFEDNRP